MGGRRESTTSERERAGTELRRQSPAPRGTPSVHTAAGMLELQRTIGNRAVGRLAGGRPLPGVIQPKLRVGPAGDRFEREADRVADDVMRDLATVTADEEAGQVRRSVDGDVVGLEGGPLGSDTEAAIQRDRGRGASLPAPLLRSMEGAFGADFGGVRVHTGTSADGLNRSLQSRAFTVGRDIFFARNQYQPQSSAGRRLLAHELTHTVQQGGAGEGVAPDRVRRAIDTNLWNTKIEPNVGLNTWAVVRDDATNARKVVRKTAAGGFEFSTNGTVWVAIPALPGFLGAHTWEKKFNRRKDGQSDVVDFGTPNALTSNIDPGAATIPMDVQDVTGDRHSLVHHSYSTYKTPAGKRAGSASKRREAGHHLTVENAHVLFLMEVANEKTSTYLNKTTKDKPAINRDLLARGATGLDNINFFPQKGSQTARDLTNAAIPTEKLPEMEDEASADVDPQLSLAQYATFIQKALDSLPNVPPVYGAKILHSVNVVAGLAHLDAAQLFLKPGRGDDRQVVRAVMTIAHRNLAQGLVIPPAAMAVFEKYVTDKPQLPFAEPVVGTTEWVPEASLANDFSTHYNELERRYVDKYYDDIVDALKAFIA